MFDWENLRHFLAVAREGTLSGAARSLKVDHATVSRRLAALEAELQAPLVERLPRSCRLTPLGLRLTSKPRPWKHRRLPWSGWRASQEPMAGKVTLSAPPVLVTHLLARRLADFRRAHPAIQLSVSAQAQAGIAQSARGRRAAAGAAARVQLPGSQAWPDAFRALCQLGLRGLAAARQLDLHRIRRSVFRHAATALAAGHRRPAGHQLRVERYQQPPGGGARRSRRPACPAFLAITAPSCCGWNTAARVLARHLAGGASRLRRSAPVRAVMDFVADTVAAQSGFSLGRPGPALATRRHEPPGRAQGESARARPADPPPAGTIAASPGLPTHLTNTPHVAITHRLQRCASRPYRQCCHRP